MGESAKRGRRAGVASMLIFEVYMLTGIAASLGTMYFGDGVKDLFEGEKLPAVTQWLIDIPYFVWLIGFLLGGGALSFWFDSFERSGGEVPRKVAAIASVAAIATLGVIVVGVSWPILAWVEKITG